MTAGAGCSVGPAGARRSAPIPDPGRASCWSPLAIEDELQPLQLYRSGTPRAIRTGRRRRERRARRRSRAETRSSTDGAGAGTGGSPLEGEFASDRGLLRHGPNSADGDDRATASRTTARPGRGTSSADVAERRGRAGAAYAVTVNKSFDGRADRRMPGTTVTSISAIGTVLVRPERPGRGTT